MIEDMNEVRSMISDLRQRIERIENTLKIMQEELGLEDTESDANITIEDFDGTVTPNG